MITGNINYGGDDLDADDKAVERMRAMIARIERGAGLTTGWVGWRAYNNTMVWGNDGAQAVLAHLYGILTLVEDRHQKCLITSWVHKDTLASLTSYDDIINYDITRGINGSANW